MRSGAVAQRFAFEHHSRRVEAVLAGTVIAATTRAVLLREPRLPPVYYFPREDVRTDLLAPSARRTHCPLLGQASYWSVRLPGREAQDIAWSYEAPLAAAEPIRGHVAFDAGRLDEIRDGGVPLAPHDPAAYAGYANPLLGWLLHEAPACGSAGDLSAALAACMVAEGIPLWRMTVLLHTLHPETFGTSYRWWRRTWAVEEFRAPHSVLESPMYLNSPVRAIFEGAGGIRRRLEGASPLLDFGILRDLHAEGATDYVAMPMPFSDGTRNVLTLASDRSGGFSTADLGHVYEIAGVLGRLYEAHAMRRTTADLLDTYLGRHAGERVLDGTIRRGAGEDIRAVIWFCDMRESTRLARAGDRREFLATLNEYFDSMAGAVLRHGGHVLRFVGDAALAIFPIAGEGEGPVAEARAAALAAAREAANSVAALNRMRRAAGRPEIGFGIGLHVGEVTYGNIGTPSRLEFTVVGEAANYAARLEALCKDLGEPIVVSAEFARGEAARFRSLGRHALRGLDEPQELFAPA